MSETFKISTEQVEREVPQGHRRDLQLDLSETHHSNSLLSPPPNSNSSISNLSDPEGSLSNDSTVDNLHSTTFPQDNVFCGVSLNLNQVFITTPVNGSGSKNLSLLSSSGTGSENGFAENECCSLSSGEMIIRTNSFFPEDQSLMVVSSLEESSVSVAAGHPALPAESNLLTTTLLDICEKSPTRVIEEYTAHPCLGMTLNQAELPAEENDSPSSNCLVALPSENDGALLMTFVCEPSPADCGQEAQFAQSVEAPPLHVPLLTSTPIQNIGNQIPSSSESPCTGNAASLGLHPVKWQQSSANPKQCLVAGLTPLASKVKKMEIKKFPMSDYRSIKSKIITRNVQHLSVLGTASQYKPSQVNVNNKHTEARRGGTSKISPSKGKISTTVASASTKMNNVTQKQGNTGAGFTVLQPGHTAVDGQGKSRASPPQHHSAADKQASAVQCSNAISETEHAASSQAADVAAQHAGSQAFCLSSLEKSPNRSSQTVPRPTPKMGVSHKIEVKSSSVLGQDKPPVFKTLSCCISESSLTSSSSPKEKKNILKFTTSLTLTKTDTHQGQTKAGNLSCTPRNKKAIQAKATARPAENSRRRVNKISLVAEESSKSTATGTSCDESKSRFRGHPSPRGTRGPPLPQTPAASPRLATPSTRQRQGTVGRDECRITNAVGTPQSKQKSAKGSHRAQAPGESSLGAASTANFKPQPNGSQTSQTPTRLSVMCLPPTPSSRLQRKTLGPSRSLPEASGHSEQSKAAGSAQVSRGPAHKLTPFKSVVLNSRRIPTPAQNNRSSLTTACRPAASISKGASSSTVSPLKRTASAKFAPSTSGGPVDKNKLETGSRQQPPHQQQQQKAPQSSRSRGTLDVVLQSVAEGERKERIIQRLRGLLAASNRRFEAIIIVQQQTLAERDEAKRQCRDLSQELVNLRGELVFSSERLEKEQDELRASLEDALQAQKEQHQRDLDELEQRLQSFYQAEWTKVHLTYQEEADKCKSHMQQQVEALTEENNSLIEKLTAEENRRRELAEKSQKDSHTLYLEQELESVKVVLDIRNKQLRQQENNLMEIDKLREKNVKLDESLKKVQQENEDLKVRMDQHTALSRQLSTEQAVLQESLQRESQVNKRLSMENEELLWKLHNGDLSSPRKVSHSSTSPSHSFTLQSPCSSGLFSSHPVSPR